MPSAELSDASGGAGPVARTGVPYDGVHRLGRPGAWRPMVGIVLLVLLLFALQLFLSGVVSTALVATGDSVDEVADKLSGDPVTPSFLALVNLGWAVAIPAAWLVVRAVHGLAPGWLSSVAPRLRWRWFLTCLALSVVALVLTVVVSALLPDQGTVDMDGALNDWTSTARDFVLVVLLLTPLQAAGEEFVFRGYLAQAFGGLAGRFGTRAGAVVAVAVPSLLFALAHGLGQDLPTFFDRFAFGVVAGVLVLLTGGLEAAIAMHVLNNFLAFGLVLAYGDMTTALNPSGGTWWSIPVTLTQSVSYLLLALWAARRIGVADRADRPGGPGGGAILETGRGRV